MSYWRFVLVLVLVFSTWAAENDDWGRVKALEKGARVTVVQTDKKSVQGLVDGASDAEIVVSGTSIPKARVVRVSRHKGSRRVTNAVVLGLAGGLIGAAAGRFGIACAETNDGCRNAALYAVGGAAGGAAIGALALPDLVEIYRIRKL